MPSTVVNFADVDSFEPLPEGSYDVEVDKVEVRQNKAGDGEYLNWELVVIDGEYENRRLWMITSLKPQALFRLKQVFEELGIIEDDEEEMEIEWDDDVEPTTSSGPRLLYPELEGLEAVAQVKNEMYDGRERNRVENLFGDKPKKKKRSAPSRDNGTGSRRSKRAREEDESRSRKGRGRGRGRDEDDDDEDEDEDEDEDDRPRRGSGKRASSSRSGTRSRRSRDEDEDEPPKSRRRSRDDEGDDEDEDEDERPRRRSSSSERTKSRGRERARRRVR